MARFSSEEKIQAVRQYIDGNEGGQTIAKSIGVHPSLLHQWIKQFDLFGDDAFEKRYTHSTPQTRCTQLYERTRDVYQENSGDF
ncbi:transposase-like protein [Peribacillus simplex]|nr:transposase [Peribacillus simplex]MDF9761434.1 transposase-like protein [Peribacillus simplex]